MWYIASVNSSSLPALYSVCCVGVGQTFQYVRPSSSLLQDRQVHLRVTASGERQPLRGSSASSFGCRHDIIQKSSSCTTSDISMSFTCCGPTCCRAFMDRGLCGGCCILVLDLAFFLGLDGGDSEPASIQLTSFWSTPSYWSPGQSPEKQRHSS